MPKGRKRIRGVPELHDELKTRVNLSLTPTGSAGLDVLAAERGLSRSELVERIGRGQICIVDYQNFPNDRDFSCNVPAKETTMPEFADDFTMSAIQVVSLNQRHELPDCPGAYLVTDFAKHSYVGHDSNLKRRFMDDRFLKQLEKFLGHQGFKEHSDIWWVECSDVKALPVVKQALIVAFQVKHDSNRNGNRQSLV